MDTTASPPPSLARPRQWLTPGASIGHYRVEELISSGGFGAVYRASRDGQRFALKLPLSDDNPSDEQRGTLERVTANPRGGAVTRSTAAPASTRGRADASPCLQEALPKQFELDLLFATNPATPRSTTAANGATNARRPTEAR